MTTTRRCRVIGLVVIVSIYWLSSVAHGLRMPGVAQAYYQQGSLVDVSVNKLTSVKTQLPYRYYDLPFCRPPDGIHNWKLGLGEVLMGDVTQNSPYDVYAQVEEKCAVVCPPQQYNKQQVAEFVEKIEQDYRVNWYLDSLPAVTERVIFEYQNEGGQRIVQRDYDVGFPLGQMAVVVTDGDANPKLVPMLNNHVDMFIDYHEDDDARYSGLNIIHFRVQARSIQHATDFDYETGRPSTCYNAGVTPPPPLFLNTEANSTSVVWTYSVHWQPSPIRWTSRWDTYLMMTDNQIHWFSIFNSLMVALFLAGMIGIITMRTIRADIRRYAEMESSQEPTGWKAIQGDVFRAPNHPMLLSTTIGSGVQVLATTVLILVLATLGFLSAANRGGLLTAMIVVLVGTSILSGYCSARMYKLFMGERWKQCALMTATLYPGIGFAIFFILNLMMVIEKSTSGVSVLVILQLQGLWIGIALPLTFAGAYLVYRKPPKKAVVRVDELACQMPLAAQSKGYLQPILVTLLGGVLPFAAIFIELFFILCAIWMHQIYFLFGFLSIAFVIMAITCAEITIILCYFQLRREDYRWWWRAFLTGGASALYMQMYGVFYFVTKLQISKAVSTMVYFGYTTIMALQLFLVAGTIGFLACFFFVRKLYSLPVVAPVA